jgi:methionyl-tRNA formyltransferase
VGEPSYYPRRTPVESQVQPDQTIAELFDLLRVADPRRFPVFFDHRGSRYVLKLERAPSPPEPGK